MIRTILWRRLDSPGHEFSRLESSDDEWILSGTALFVYEQQPCNLDYRIVCASDWRTASAEVTGRVGSREVELSVSADETRRWQLNGSECSAVSGCVDLDLGFSPSTNLLPIRRLSLAPGGEAEVRAAWLPFPSLGLEPLAQLYRREGETTYRYESADGRFVRMLEVNPTGFVTRYPGLWQAESAT